MTHDGTTTDANPAHEATEVMLRVPWIVFASGQGQREEYATTAAEGIDAELESEVSALCREFHNSLGVQQVPESPPVVLFWKARQSAQWIITRVLHAPQQPGGRIAYEYFSLAISDADLRALGGNPLRVMDLVGIEKLREHYAAGLNEPFGVSVGASRIANGAIAPSFVPGTHPATAENYHALLAHLDGGTTPSTFATWWPSANAPNSGVFDIVLRAEATRPARPHEILALAAELNRKLSQSVPAPPSYDTVGGRSHRTLLHDANEIQAMLSEAYLPAALEELPNQWLTRPQKLAGLCQKIADDLPNYAARLPAPVTPEMVRDCTELAARYEDFARELQKVRHPNVLQQGRAPIVASVPEYQASNAQNTSRKGTQLALILGSLLALCLLGFGIRALVGGANTQPHPQSEVSTKRAGQISPKGKSAQSDEQAIAVLRARAESEVFRVAYALANERALKGKGLSKSAMENTIVDAVAQAMSQTPQAQIKPAQKQLLFRMATAPIRAKAKDGAKAGALQRARR